MQPLPTLKDLGRADAEKPSAMDRSKRTPLWRRRDLWLWGLAAGVLLGMAFLVLRLGLQRSAALARERVSLGTARHTRFSEYVPVNGSLVPRDTVFLDTVEGGRVMAVHLEDGAVVEKGVPLVTLRNVDLELQIASQETRYTEQLGNLARAQIQFDQSELSYTQQLMKAGLQIRLARSAIDRRLPRELTGVAEAEIDKLRAELAHQEATQKVIAAAKKRDRKNSLRNLNKLRESVQRMEHSLTLLRENLDALTVRAPITGQLSALSVRVGEVVSPGSRMGQVDRIGRYRVRALVDEFYLDRVQLGQTATGDIGKEGNRLRVQKIYPNVENRRFRVDLDFVDQAPKGLRRGQTLWVRIALSDAADTLTIPNGPFYEQTGGKWVFVVNGNRAEPRPVTLGRRNPKRIEVLSGLAVGEEIIASSYEGLTTMDQLRLVGE